MTSRALRWRSTLAMNIKCLYRIIYVSQATTFSMRNGGRFRSQHYSVNRRQPDSRRHWIEIQICKTSTLVPYSSCKNIFQDARTTNRSDKFRNLGSGHHIFVTELTSIVKHQGRNLSPRTVTKILILHIQAPTIKHLHKVRGPPQNLPFCSLYLSKISKPLRRDIMSLQCISQIPLLIS